jgi:PAS domain S-box-containing protein
MLKSFIRRIHSGEDVENLKREFSEKLKGVTPFEIASIEEELIREGLPREEVQRLCEVHIAMFKESLESSGHIAPEGHPIYILMEEHKHLQEGAFKLNETAKSMLACGALEDVPVEKLELVHHITEHMRDSESHYVREENVLFPYLEKHGITQPPQIMWMEHQTIRQTKKRLFALVDSSKTTSFSDFKNSLYDISIELVELLSSHFFKENNILFPTAMRIFTEEEWKEVRRGFDELGYCCFTPAGVEHREEKVSAQITQEQVSGMINFETGSFTLEELQTLLNAVPFDITFVDADDKVRYFNESRERIFPRTRAVIGRTVQNCHPQKSVHVVNKILEEFRAGTRDVAEFWINKGEKLIHIRYFPLRSKDGKYLGCIEVTQDITDIKKLEGEKRLL